VKKAFLIKHNTNIKRILLQPLFILQIQPLLDLKTKSGTMETQNSDEGILEIYQKKSALAEP